MKNDSLSKPLTMEAIASRLSISDKATFFDVFWKTWSANGFGTLSKKDTELLMFMCLKKSLGRSAPNKQYDWAKLLRLTPSRVRSIQLEAYLRFGQLVEDKDADPTAWMGLFFSKLYSVDIGAFASKGSVDSVSVCFVIEDPVMQMELDRRVKGIGGYVNYLRNRDVVVLRFPDFLRLITPDQKTDLIDAWVRQKAVETDEANGLRKRLLAQGFANMTGLQQLSAFADDLAETAKIAPLVTRMKTIFAGEKERKK